MLKEMDLRELKTEFNLQIKGIIQVGSFLAKEYPILKNLGVNDFIFLEANPNIISELKSNIDPECLVFNELVADEDEKEYTFQIANHGQSSSMLNFDKHKDYHPEFSTVVDTVNLKSIKLDTLITRESINMEKYNCLMVDVQGAEIHVLKGFEKNLDYIDYIHAELNYDSMYEGCCLEPVFTEYLHSKGFNLVKSFNTGLGWGDGLYIRQNA